jgi:hypothetical protein
MLSLAQLGRQPGAARGSGAGDERLRYRPERAELPLCGGPWPRRPPLAVSTPAES